MSNRKRPSQESDGYRILREVVSSLLFTLGVFSSLSLIFYSTRIDLNLKGTMGSIGVVMAKVLGISFGISSFIIPLILFYTSFVLFRNRFSSLVYTKLAAALTLLTGAATLFGLLYQGSGFMGYDPAGGWFGNALAGLLREDIAGTVGSFMIAAIFVAFSLMVIANLTLTKIFNSLKYLGSLIVFGVISLFRLLYGELGKVKSVKAGSFGVLKNLRNPVVGHRINLQMQGGGNSGVAAYGVMPTVLKDDPGFDKYIPQIRYNELENYDDQDDVTSLRDHGEVELAKAPRYKNGTVRRKLFKNVKTTPQPVSESSKRPQIIVEKTVANHPEEFASSIHNKNQHDYRLPPLELLDPKISVDIKVDKETVYNQAKLIEEKLADFGVKGRVTEIRPGPVITMYEYKPAPGIKINKISSLDDDLAMALSAISVRIVAPIPGKDVVGIEVPNENREVVVLRELLENKSFIKSESMLTLAIGKDISGNPYYTDLRKAPHLMIAGTTGSGKSVLLHSLITSLLYKASPSELKFIMVDPKMLELSVYEDIPQLLHPIVTDPKEAAAALNWAVREMEMRYRKLSAEGVRDIEGYNKKMLEMGEEQSSRNWLPYIVIVLDELADLMMISPREVGESITRLAQKARAAGIHLIVATQRPSADVVAGLIKANFPARISFLVSSKIDSRIILDVGGAEQLLGKGDMLLLQPGTFNLIRLQGALISDRERDNIAEYIRSEAPPVYNQEITVFEDPYISPEDDDRDELFFKALQIVAKTKLASISMLQRKMKIGYNRAARIVEIMEQEGIIGPQTVAGKPREVSIDLDEALKRYAN